jgi:hypothetical protein
MGIENWLFEVGFEVGEVGSYSGIGSACEGVCLFVECGRRQGEALWVRCLKSVLVNKESQLFDLVLNAASLDNLHWASGCSRPCLWISQENTGGCTATSVFV